MQTFDVAHGVAVILVGMLVLHGLQAIAEHYFPNTEATAAARFILGGP
jgi:hypothetical protein